MSFFKRTKLAQDCRNPGGGGGDGWVGGVGGTPLYGLYRYVRPKRVGCLSGFGGSEVARYRI